MNEPWESDRFNSGRKRPRDDHYHRDRGGRLKRVSEGARVLGRAATGASAVRGVNFTWQSMALEDTQAWLERPVVGR